MCQSSPCKNEGKCLTVGTNDYICQCKSGFSGDHCETAQPDDVPPLSQILQRSKKQNIPAMKSKSERVDSMNSNFQVSNFFFKVKPLEISCSQIFFKQQLNSIFKRHYREIALPVLLNSAIFGFYDELTLVGFTIISGIFQGLLLFNYHVVTMVYWVQSFSFFCKYGTTKHV